MGWFITLGVLVLLAAAPLGVNVIYHSEGLLVRLILGPVRLTLLPGKRKSRKKKKRPEKGQSERQQAEQPQKNIKQVGKDHPDVPPRTDQQNPQKGGSLLDFLPLVRTLLDFLGDFRRKLRLNNLELKLILAGDDPCDLAVNYGRAWEAVGNLLPKLEQWFVIKKRNIEVECDFTAAETLVTARLELTISLGRLLAALARFAFRAVKEYLKINKKRKGGAKQ